ncbi:acyltransferase family protein [Shewanella baltica]|uniref:acyltransferase family protein n=1 Tax=Shewanella baltica TaxID=62322 RepID=UPI00217D5B99|nr:acyltransferase family protein [Shewanella baltica]MCS6180061.1 acyltransferase [Shewanella baltica]MCS6256120.1 acyltransferase [Shewanella baltica]
MQFRKDINGLRAIAVIAVVIFHFNSSWMPGGFAGVDVFFVISGFLMTGIIFRGIEQENFSILKFYVARANRIIPALAVLCMVLLVFGWFCLMPLEYMELGKHVASSMGFFSNMTYWRESGYFDAVSQEKWLLHTWSLSVEWQFYIIYPLVLVAMKKFMSLKSMKSTVLVGTVLGFLFCVVATYKWPSPAYYLLPTRAWEMMIGGIACLYPLNLSESKKKLFEWFGLALICLSYFFISKDNLWPGYLSLIPVLGAFLLIQAQRNDSILTGNVFFQKLGRWSYSIYLWHWPFVVAIYFYTLSEVFIYFGMVLSIFIGFISNKYIERVNFKSDFINLVQYLKCKPLYFVIIMTSLGGGIFLTNGLDYRLDSELMIKNINAIEAIGDWDYPKSNLKIGESDIRFIKGSSDKNILFIGASHIEQTYPFVKSFGSKYNIYYVTMGGCFVSPSFINPRWSCLNVQNYKEIMNEVKFDKIVTSIYTIDSFLSDNELEKTEQLKKRINEYNDFLRFSKKHSNKVYVILGEPEGSEFDPKLSMKYSLNNFITVEDARKKYKIHYSVLEKLSEIKDVSVIDPIKYLCSDVCLVMDDSFNYYYKDDSHMRPWYAKISLNYLEDIIK